MILGPFRVPGGSRGQFPEILGFWRPSGPPFASLLGSFFAQNAIKKTIKISTNFSIVFSSILRPKMPPKTLQKPFRNSFKNQLENPTIFSLIFHWFLNDFSLILECVFRSVLAGAKNAATHDPLENFRVDRGSQLSDFFWNASKNH